MDELGKKRSLSEGLDLDLNKEPEPESEVQFLICTLCMEQIEEDGGRATLQCGHKFHLDCIGSFFNVKGYMKCPDCRHVEWGNWMFSLKTGNIRTDEDLINWIANHHPFFVVPRGYHLCAIRGLVGPDNNTVGGQVFYGMANQDYWDEWELQEHQDLSPNGQTEDFLPPDDVEEGSFSPHNRIPIRMFGMDHQETLHYMEMPAQNPSAPNTSFSGSTFSGSSTQRASLFNSMATEPIPSLSPSTEGIQFPFEFSQEAAISSPLSSAVRRAFACLAPPAGQPSTITANSAHLLHLVGVTMHNQDTPAPNTPLPPQENENGPQENGHQ